MVAGSTEARMSQIPLRMVGEAFLVQRDKEVAAKQWVHARAVAAM